MNEQQLKNSILQLAIQGKLVPQDYDEESASVLLEKIKKSKAQLFHDGKIKKTDLKDIPFSHEDVPFDLPDNWIWCRLKTLCSRFSTGPFGTMLHKEDYVAEGGIPLINPTNIKGAKVDGSNIKRVGKEKYNELLPYVLHTGDIVLARRGDLSKCAVITDNEDGWLAGTGAFFLHIEQVYLPFFSYIYRSPYVQGYLTSDSVGTTMDNLNQTLLGNLLFPLPPFDEQVRIVAKIEELLPFVEEYGRAQNELNTLNATLPSQLRQSILLQAMRGKLVSPLKSDESAESLLRDVQNEMFQKIGNKYKQLVPVEDIEKPFDVPAHWLWVRYRDIAECELGKAKNPNEDNVNLFPYLCTINVYWNRISLETLKVMPFSSEERLRYLAKKGDMFICEGGEAGRAAIWGDQTTEVCFQNALHRVRFASMIDPRFYLYQMMLYKTAGFLNDYIKGETIQHFVLGKLQSLPIPLPPLDEQKRIVAKIEDIFSEIDKL